MNDSVEPVDLSPTRVELIARVRTRGRQIRARRRAGMTALATVLVVAIAVPAIAIGTRSSSRSVPPAASHSRGFGIAVIRGSAPQSASQSCHGGSLPAAGRGECLTLSKPYAGRESITSVAVQPRGGSWAVAVDIDIGIAIDLARFHEPHGWAVVLDGTVIGTITPATFIGAATVETTFVVAEHLTHAGAVALGTRIWGRAPRTFVAPPGLSSYLELPSPTFVAGSTVHGNLEIDNTTDHPITLERPGQCRIKWGVTLVAPGGTAHMTFTQECSNGRTVLQPGVNRFPFVLSTIAAECRDVRSQGPGTAPLCGIDHNPPPLPPGRYEAVLVSSTPGLLPDAPRVTIQLTAAP